MKKGNQSAALNPQTVPARPTGTWRGEIPLESFYTAGLGGQIFFRALKERGELVGTCCEPCQQVYLPARAFCERCFAELKAEVKVKPEGTVASFTFAYVDRDGHPLERPQALALVQLEGATTLFLHRLLKVNDPSQVKIGARVRVVIKPKSKRTGSILDLEGFELA
ncbi:MAG: Zn-ribbon domain-containing OB-fold protein [Terriglobia bacterium]